MNRRRLAAAGLGALLFLGACGAEEESTRGRADADITEKEESGQAAGTAEGSIEPVPAGETDPQPAAAGSFADAFAKGEVENNGAYFVRVGDKIYYRAFSTDSLHRTALFGSFLDDDIPSAPSALVRVDCETGEKEELFTVHGSGRLYAGAEGFYLADSENLATSLIPMDGSAQSVYCMGTPNGVSADGRILEVTRYDEATGFFGEVLVRDGKDIAQLSYDEMDGVFFCGFAGEDAFFAARPAGEEAWSVYSVDETGTRTDLGQIDTGDREEWLSYLIPEPEQILWDEEGVYLSFGYYDGTGHMLTAWSVLSVQPGVADSVEMIQIENHADELLSDRVQRMLLTRPGEVELFDVIGGDVLLSEGYYGDLVCYDGPYSEMILQKDFCPDQAAGGKNFLLDGAVFGDTAFVITAYGTRNEHYDIGWREAYDLDSLGIYRVPFDDAHMENGVAKEMEALEFLTSSVWGDRIDYNRDLAGIWRLEYYETEGASGNAEEDGLESRLIFEDDGSVYLEENADGKLQRKALEPDERDTEGEYVFFTDDGGDEMWFEMLYCNGYRLEVSVSWQDPDGTPGGSTWGFIRE